MMQSSVLLALLLLGCAEGGEEPPLACASAEIVGGGPTPTLGDSHALRQAVVAVLVAGANGSFAGLCSGVVVAPRAVLTAAHCLGPRAASDAAIDPSETVVAFVDQQSSVPREVGVRRSDTHPELDLALLELDGRDLGQPAAAAVPLHLEPFDTSWVGSTVELSGFGSSETGELGQLSFVTERIVRLETDHLVVDGRGQTGACVGDSGGPLLGRTNDGRSQVLAVLDAGSASCVGEDFYTRLDRVADWEPLALALARAGKCRR